jgi:DnaJ-class molecular chaperone
MSSDERDQRGNDWLEEPDDSERCSLCGGGGQINALTDQSYIFVASYADCPRCDGTGRAP